MGVRLGHQSNPGMHFSTVVVPSSPSPPRCQQEPLQMPLSVYPPMPLSIQPPDAHEHPLRKALEVWLSPIHPIPLGNSRRAFEITPFIIYYDSTPYPPTPPNVTPSLASRLYTKYGDGNSSNLLPGAKKNSRVRAPRHSFCVFLIGDETTPNQPPGCLDTRRGCSIPRTTAG